MPPLRPTYTLTVGGLRSTADEPVAGPRSFVIDRDMDVPADALGLELRERAGVSVGDAVTLELGHDGEEETVFTGTVESVRPSVTGASVRALGAMNDLLNLRASATFSDQSAGSIVRDLIGRSPLSAGAVDEGPILPRYTVDSALSVYGHLRDLADRLGYELYADREGNVMFHALGPAAGLDSPGGTAGLVGSVVGLAGEVYAFGQQLLRAGSGRRAASWGTIEVGGESPMSRQGDATEHWLSTNDDHRGSAGDGGPALLVRDPAARTRDLADRFAAGRLAVAARATGEVSVTIFGRPGLDLGDDLAVAGAPDEQIDGSGYVRALRHRLDGEVGFVTEARIFAGDGT